MSDFNRAIIDEFRANEGRVGGMFEGAKLVLLTTTGARSGRPHTTPAAYAEDAGRLIVFASNSGLPTAPAWLHNLRANPAVIVELGSTRFDAIATEVTGPERDRLYADQSARDPAFAAYQAGTTRKIQVVELIPARIGAATAQLKEVHAALRRQLADLRTAVDAQLASAGRDPADTGSNYAEGPNPANPPDLAGELTDLRTHCLSFCGALHAHHTREDGVLPHLAAGFPELKPAIDRLQREHEAVAVLNEELAATVERLTTHPGEAENLRDQLMRLAAELESHYLYEELHLGPALDQASAG
ncbi:deazaflavin-dependent oxidoreductase (nitroreductase family) [Kribbella sp. VKM Ac-2527]|uniref:Deazaflavin-dependent oxidoreductase (Nitroreductase family) n=1 Tax=Kribbella caucasensis TaxID=2512215 RepID=A0A4R6K714_9ACTN|nr:nitroreductase/quinone reductase family protein [Kribbella sp. VKM Ac-2527]TDO44131.1 deazaflavin-dependent oxidoreductase (nitroreductase family) [Kribbella sp. VKM Ac-2527]